MTYVEDEKYYDMYQLSEYDTDTDPQYYDDECPMYDDPYDYYNLKQDYINLKKEYRSLAKECYSYINKMERYIDCLAKTNAQLTAKLNKALAKERRK